jgi:Fur family peroxide stress response transcriptional regulator
LANTHQRQVLYRALAESDEHLSPEELYDKVKGEVPEISLATVYRNIKIFKKCGILEEVTPLHDSYRLDPNLTDHHHLVCRFCQSIVDVPNEDIEPIRFRNGPPSGFTVERYEILGMCSRCAVKVNANSAVSTLKTLGRRTVHAKSSQTNG